jgi:rhamnulokinase
MSHQPLSLPSFLAFDLGAASGRAMLGTHKDDQIVVEEIHRFANGAVNLPSGLHWDILQMWTEIQRGLGKAVDKAGSGLQSVGLDTWGVDYALLAADDSLLGNPYHYRDGRTDGILERAFRRVPREEIYRRTGVQLMQINSLFQLLAMRERSASLLDAADRFLNIPDLFNFWLSGKKVSEFTIVTTTQCYNPYERTWDRWLLKQMDIPASLFGEIVSPGTVLGPLRPAVCEETGAPPLTVIASAGHDTACAVAAVPATQPDFIYISSGTWSLVGVEIETPIINQASMAADMTNEGGVGGTFRFLKNVMGLWLLQECRREWQRTGETLSYDDLTRMAAEAPAFGPLVLPNDPRFLAPGDMAARIQQFCRETGQPVPESRGEIVRTVLESLALEYRVVTDRLAALQGKPLPVIHIIGGGSQNKLLNQFAADATGRQVIAGPVEATAIGNVLVQMMALGRIRSAGEGRELVRRSFVLETFEPANSDAWEATCQRYQRLKQQAEA